MSQIEQIKSLMRAQHAILLQVLLAQMGHPIVAYESRGRVHF